MSGDQFKNMNLAKMMRESPFREEPFNDELKEKIRLQTAKRRSVNGRGMKRRFSIGLAAIAVLAIFAWFASGGLQQAASPNRAAITEARTVYMVNGVVKFEIYPEGNFTAGVPQGLIVSFREPFETYAGKELTVKAVHTASGAEQTLVDRQKITEPSSGYSTLNRYTVANAGLPLSGFWRIVVELDGSTYGDAVLEAEEPSWDESPTFVSGPYTIRGMEKRLAVLENGFIAGKSNKYMWSLWGEESELNGSFKVEAVKQGDVELVPLFELDHMGGSSEYADRYFPSSFMLPEPGKWRIMAYVDGRLFGSIVVQAERPDKPGE
ncbi:DUF4871 domain-containing protein [Paenibacillus sp. NEAU-GSW1]|uniref:DUF4871 domain-containing protein n=1 Tax=Paenibacillus sp. NEAU-GSW1 TaxID=2682486 RepID=UPI0012E327D7|nr:DUF4871 domain-containing protein [Paenibacillus sp. NEAU-GSW1]MUT66629.1 DUF4871 domain-containing protein [Paenibacillus sp. NEAU-GSW1]